MSHVHAHVHVHVCEFPAHAHVCDMCTKSKMLCSSPAAYRSLAMGALVIGYRVTGKDKISSPLPLCLEALDCLDFSFA